MPDASSQMAAVLATTVRHVGTGVLMRTFQLEPRCSTRHTREASTASPTGSRAMP